MAPTATTCAIARLPYACHARRLLRGFTTSKVLQSALASEPASTPSSVVTPPTYRAKFNLPAHKLRSLISLYHQSSSFVTPENLDQVIEDTFVAKPTLASSRDPRLSYPELRVEVNVRNNTPDFHPASHALSRLERGPHALDVLYGTANRKPGLAMLLERWPHTSRILAENESDEIADDAVPQSAPIVPGTRKIGETIVVLGPREKRKRQRRKH